MARFCGLVLVCFALVAAAASATQFRVGGQRGWSVPDAGAEPYNAWAGRMRFQIGDQLLFVYPKETDSVLLVEQGAYDACNATSYVQKFDDGSTVFTLDRSGPFFFISGSEASCRANEKLIVVVLADRSGGRTPPGVSPSPPSMPPPSAAPMPSPPSPSPMLPPSAAPMPSPPSPSPMPPPSGAPVPSPSSSTPSGAPMPSPAATPSSAPSPSASAPGPAPTATPGSPPPPTASAPGPAPTATPGSPPSPGVLAPSPSSSPGTPGGVPQPPSASTTPPGSEGANSTTTGSGASRVSSGLVSSLAAYIGYAMLAL